MIPLVYKLENIHYNTSSMNSSSLNKFCKRLKLALLHWLHIRCSNGCWKSDKILLNSWMYEYYPLYQNENLVASTFWTTECLCKCVLFCSGVCYGFITYIQWSPNLHLEVRVQFRTSTGRANLFPTHLVLYHLIWFLWFHLPPMSWTPVYQDLLDFWLVTHGEVRLVHLLFLKLSV